MRALFQFIFLFLLLTSCTTNLKIAKSKQAEVTDLGISWITNDEVRDLDKIKIDSVMAAVMERFNNGAHNFKVHRSESGDENTLYINFENGRFIKPGGVAAGYILTTLGLTACPILIASATDGGLFLIFWVIPQDHVNATAILSPNLSAKPNAKAKIWTHSSALFRSQTKRIKRVNERLADDMYRLISNLKN